MKVALFRLANVICLWCSGISSFFFFLTSWYNNKSFSFHPVSLEEESERWLPPVMGPLSLENCFNNYPGFDVCVSICVAIP